MSGPVNIGSSAEWQRMLSDTTVVVADFYADWCGPCKQIAPHFERLAKEHSKPKKVAFAKINVDTQQSISSALGVSAMPTFKIFRGGSCIETIKGANPSALTDAVTRAVNMVGGGKGGPAGDVFAMPGKTLGGSGSAGGAAAGPGLMTMVSRRIGFGTILSMLVSFVGLYFVSLFSLDPYKAAEYSMFNIHKTRPPPDFKAPGSKGSSSGSGSNNAKNPPKPKFATMADL